MFSKLIASLLVVLVAAPFTAPFPTCDPGALFGGDMSSPPIAASPMAAISIARFTMRRAKEEGEPTAPVRVLSDVWVPVVPYLITARHNRGVTLLRAASIARVSTSLPVAFVQASSRQRSADTISILSVIRV